MNKKILLSVMAIVVLLVSGCVSESQPVPTVTSVPADAQTEIVLTATVNPTSTSIPTQTETPIPDWVTSFTEPILKAIENQPPKFQDDFSNTNSNWIVGKQGENLGPATALPTPNPGIRSVGETGYVDDEYFTKAEPNSCLGGTNSRIGDYQDFVAEFDARFVSSTNDGWQLQFHNNRNGLYTVSIVENFSDIWIQKCVSEASPVCENIAKSRDSQIKNGLEWNHMILIVRGARIGVYANGAPVLYTEDKLFSEKFKMGTFSLSICNTGNVPVEIRWDNLKLWDISNLP